MFFLVGIFSIKQFSNVMNFIPVFIKNRVVFVDLNKKKQKNPQKRGFFVVIGFTMQQLLHYQ